MTMPEEKWLDDRACAMFGRAVLQILEAEEWWSTDTFVSIVEAAGELGLVKEAAEFESSGQPYPGPDLYLPDAGTSIVVPSESGEIRLMLEGDTVYVYFEAPREDEVSRAEVVITRCVTPDDLAFVRLYDQGSDEPLEGADFVLSSDGKWRPE
jgi:hypothetical protein